MLLFQKHFLINTRNSSKFQSLLVYSEKKKIPSQLSVSPLQTRQELPKLSHRWPRKLSLGEPSNSSILQRFFSAARPGCSNRTFLDLRDLQLASKLQASAVGESQHRSTLKQYRWRHSTASHMRYLWYWATSDITAKSHLMSFDMI